MRTAIVATTALLALAGCSSSSDTPSSSPSASQAASLAAPIVVDPGIVKFVESLDPSALSDADFDGLLAAVGMAGGEGIGLPEEMAQINALLDIASPAMREALLTVFMDRLLRAQRSAH